MTLASASPACRVCGGALHQARLDLGDQPLCNRFLRSADEPEERFPLALATCPTCGVMQLVAPPPARALRPRFDWITYNEAEAHLDPLVARLRELDAWGPGRVVGGVSYKDTTTLARVAAGGATTWEIDAAALGLPAGRVEIDAVQDRLDPARARAVAAARPPADLLLVRHVVEHAHDLPSFLEAVAALVKPDGWLVFEAPDASGMLALSDYSAVWEEHVTYFTPATLTGALARHGFVAVEATVHPYPFENALLVVARRGPARPAREGSAEACAAALRYFADFPVVRRRHLEALATARPAGRPVALLGAGHLGCTWLNLVGAEAGLDLVIDDDPRRAGLLMPGSRLPIVGSAALLERGVGLCLLAVNPLAEDRVVERHRAFTAQGGVFRSIFAASPRALAGARP